MTESKKYCFYKSNLILQVFLLLWVIGTNIDTTFSMQEGDKEHTAKHSKMRRFIPHSFNPQKTLRELISFTKGRTYEIAVTDPTSGLIYQTPIDITAAIVMHTAIQNFLFCYSLGELRLVCKRWYLIIKQHKQVIDSSINLMIDVRTDRNLERFKYRFSKSTLIFKDKGTRIELPFDQLDNIFQGKFFLYSCGKSISQSIAIFTGFPTTKWQKGLMPNQVGIWIVPRFIVAQDIKEGKNKAAVVKRFFRNNSFEFVWPEKSEVSIIYTYKDARLSRECVHAIFGKTMAQLSNDGSLYHLWHNQHLPGLVTHPPEVYAMEAVLHCARYLHLQLLSDDYIKPTLTR